MSNSRKKTKKAITVEDIELETIRMRLDGVRQSITRARTTLLISTIAAGAIFITAWNAYLSWDRGFIEQPYWSRDSRFGHTERLNRVVELQKQARINAEKLKEEDIKAAEAEGIDPSSLPDIKVDMKIDPKSLTSVTDYAQQQLAAEWIKNQIITVSLLGIRISVNDLPVIGSLSLLIICIWFFYSARRENRAIGTLLRDSYPLKSYPSKDWHVGYMIYQGIVHHLVLIDLGRGIKPMVDYTIEESDNSQHPQRKGKGRSLRDQATRFINYLVRRALALLFYLPPISIAFVIGMDILTLLYFDAPFRPSHKPLIDIITPKDKVKVFAMEALAFLLLLATTILCRKVRTLIRATETMLKAYRAELKRLAGELRISD